jgi:hypothetical protein
MTGLKGQPVTRPRPGASDEERRAYLHALARSLGDAGVRPGDQYVPVRFTPEDPDRLKFARGSDTSRNAALDNFPRKGTQRHRILEQLDLAGDRGLTCDQLEQQLVMRHQTASARVHELLHAGFIAPHGQRRTRSGSLADVMVRTDKGAA